MTTQTLQKIPSQTPSSKRLYNNRSAKVRERIMQIMKLIKERPYTANELKHILKLSDTQVKYILWQLELRGAIKSTIFGGVRYYYIDESELNSFMSHEITKVWRILCSGFSKAKGCVSKIVDKVAREYVKQYDAPLDIWTRAKIRDALAQLGLNILEDCIPTERIREICK